ncbi:hypothetical protein BC628DRAFT_1392115 [Trametes gibbosa]|nr:hypothetical protein BC628DRAFT_1392115 [Trametes gibbosa]
MRSGFSDKYTLISECVRCYVVWVRRHRAKAGGCAGSDVSRGLKKSGVVSRHISAPHLVERALLLTSSWAPTTTMSAITRPHPFGIPSIHHLPPELLIDVFVACSDDPSDDLSPIVLTQVCRYWRDVAYLSPRIWQRIYLYEHHPSALSHDQAAWWIYKSEPLPFDVRVEARTPDMILPLLSPILSRMSRLRKCTIAGTLQEEFDFSKYDFDRSRGAIVEDLRIILKGISAMSALALLEDSDSMDETPVDIFRVHNVDSSPELTMHLSLYALPLASAMTPIPIVSLYVSEYSLDVTTDVVRMLNFLRCLPLLETFHFAGWPQEGEPILPGLLQPVRLTKLRSLLLRSTCSIRAILSHLDAPALEELHLEHTNVDFELRTDPYVAQQSPPEEGESDDEAHDFSQSPWSDHATGMGLRALLRRSRPPLRVLHMDYADMRTKDFRWCFDHLDRLREFRIVGSDMSDRVVGMLAPVRRRWLTFGLANSRKADDPRGVWDVRMPRLTKLTIWHCQRVSGDALVQALQERVRFTDWAMEDGRADTVESVAIVGCSEFLQHHGQSLADTLGERLRAT